MKTLDIVIPSSEYYSANGARAATGMIKEVNITQGNPRANVVWFGENDIRLKSAWWSESELTVIDNLPNVLTREMAHPFGNNGNKDAVAKFFPIKPQS